MVIKLVQLIWRSNSGHIQRIHSADNPCYRPSNLQIEYPMPRSTPFRAINGNYCYIDPFYPRVWASKAGFAIREWARPDLNWRSSPCQGDVITPRPRALWIRRTELCIWMIRICQYKSAYDFRNLTGASRLRTCPTYTLSTIGHCEMFDVLHGTIRLTF